MSVFKRLSNVARGKMKELGKTLESGFPDANPNETRPIDPTGRKTPAPPSTSDKRVMLERLHEEGLLTDEELEEKLAALEAPSAVRPKKRHL